MKLPRFFRRKKMEIHEVVDEIINRLEELVNAGAGMGEMMDMAMKLEREYARKTGLRVRVHVDEDSATIWVSDVKFEYQLVDEAEEDEIENVEKPEKPDTSADSGMDGLPYIR